MTNTPTRPETMVERVDRVIHEKVFEIYDIKLLNSPGELGRAAIEAMREPTDAMVEAADWIDGSALAHWQAMINEALK